MAKNKANVSEEQSIDPKTEYSKAVKAFHKASDRHVLVLEANATEDQKRKVFHSSNSIRVAGNELTGIMKNNLEQLFRTKKYRKLQKLYAKAVKANDEKKRTKFAKQMQEMQKQYNVTWEFCRTSMIPIAKKYGVDAVFGLTKAEDIWCGVEECLYGDGKNLHFAKKGDLPVIRAKQPNRGIIVKENNNGLEFGFRGASFTAKINDRFERDEVNAILAYLANPEAMDKFAVRTFRKHGISISTYRPCYASLVCEEIRGKLHIYIHITLEGRAMPKYNKDGSRRHKFGVGIVADDIGVQTHAYTSDTEVGLKNLAERGSSVFDNERKERKLKRKMDRSRRATNPDNYNENGTVKKGRKTWKKSNRYRKTEKRYKNFARKNAVNRHLAIQEEVNYLRSLGDTFVTEPMNWNALKKRAKTKDKENISIPIKNSDSSDINMTLENNVCERIEPIDLDTAFIENNSSTKEPNKENKSSRKNKRKRRYGKSIQNRCPGYFQQQIKIKFKNYIEVSKEYRASQYDHTCDDYIKKKLSQRMFKLGDGTLVQRDWYSSFLLYCIDLNTGQIDKQKCVSLFDEKYKQEIKLIERIKASNIKIMNSGIKTKAS